MYLHLVADISAGTLPGQEEGIFKEMYIKTKKFKQVIALRPVSSNLIDFFPPLSIKRERGVIKLEHLSSSS